MVIKAKIITNPKSKAYGKIGFSEIIPNEISIYENREIYKRLESEITRLINYYIKNEKNITKPSERSYYHKKPNTLLKLELLLKIMYGKTILVEY